MSSVVHCINVESPTDAVFGSLTSFEVVSRYFPVVQRPRPATASPALPSWCIPGRVVAWDSVSHSYRIDVGASDSDDACLLVELEGAGTGTRIKAELQYEVASRSVLAWIVQRLRLRRLLRRSVEDFGAYMTGYSSDSSGTQRGEYAPVDGPPVAAVAEMS